MSCASFQKAGESENQEAYCFDHCRKKLSVATPSDAAPLQNPKSHNDRHRDDFYFFRPSQEGKEMPAIFADDDGNGSGDRKSTRLNSSHEWISYAVFCLKKK